MWTKVQHSIFLCREVVKTVNDQNAIEILLVEDNPRDAELTIRALNKKDLAKHLYHVEDGVEALDFLFGRGKYSGRDINAAPKVVLLDLKLPRVNGLEVLSAMKSDERTQTIPVVIVTSSAEDPDIQTAYQLGANSYVLKPVQFESFIEAMAKIGVYWLRVNHPMKK
jgi:two-component system response regulator